MITDYIIQVGRCPTRRYACGLLRAVRLYLSEFNLHGEVCVTVNTHNTVFVVRDAVDTYIVGKGKQR